MYGDAALRGVASTHYGLGWMAMLGTTISSAVIILKRSPFSSD